MKPHLIMPMGGAGSRFFKNGFMQPKPLIEIYQKPFLFWSTMSIKRYVNVQDITFVVLKQHIDEFSIDREIHNYFPTACIKVIPEVLPGPVYTALEGISDIDDDAPIIFNDCDHMFCCKDIYNILNKELFTEDGALLTFESKEPQFSYVKYENNKVVGTVEKRVVSSHAICGAYIFKNSFTFKEAANKYIADCPYNECFMSGVYNVICKNGGVVKDYMLDFHVEFGTPEEYNDAMGSDKFILLNNE